MTLCHDNACIVSLVAFSHAIVVSSLAVDSFPCYVSHISRLCKRLFLFSAFILLANQVRLFLYALGGFLIIGHKAFHRDSVNMLSESMVKILNFFLDKFLWNRQDIIACCMYVSYWFHSIISIVKSCGIYRYIFGIFGLNLPFWS